MAEVRKLKRSISNRKIAGVCGGLAEYYAIDATLFRVLFVVATFAGGLAVLFYILLWLTLPEE